MPDKERIKLIISKARGLGRSGVSYVRDKVSSLLDDAKEKAGKIVEATHADVYSGKEYTFEDAYKDARSKGQRTFFWDGKYYNTDYEGEHGRKYRRDVASGKAAAFQAAYPEYTNPELRKEKQEELDTYGITNEQTQNKSLLHERALKNLDFYGDYDWKQAVDALVLNHDQRAESDTSPENLTHYQQLRFYLGYPLLEQDAGLARRGLNGYGAPVKISAFRPTTGTNSTPYYYTFLRNPYGNKGLTAGPARDKYERLIKASEDYLNGEFYKDAEKHGLDYAVRVADENTKRWCDYFDNHLDELADLERLKNFIPATYRGKFETKDYGNASGLGNFTQYGTPEYRSFYDLWDIGLGQGNNTLTFGLGKPFEYYDRRYHDDETKQNIANPDIDSLYSNFDYSVGGPLLHRFDTGGDIHISESKRGTFTAAAKRHGMSVQAFASRVLANKDNYSPSMVKKANFARNAAKWHAVGGPLKSDDRLRSIVDRINNTSNADFVKRLLDKNRKVIDNGDGTVSTHELGYVTEGNGAVVFPQVQSVDDSLVRFPYPQSYDRAVENGDTVHMSVPDARRFTRGYKYYYPGFDQYAAGGIMNTYDGETEDQQRMERATGFLNYLTAMSMSQEGTSPYIADRLNAVNSGDTSHMRAVGRADGGLATLLVSPAAALPFAVPSFFGANRSVAGYVRAPEQIVVETPVVEDTRGLALKDIQRRIYEQENDKGNPDSGWNEEEQRWYPHKSVEGGEPTIGYGIKLVGSNPWVKLAKKQGYLTDQQARDAVVDLTPGYYDAARAVFDGKYGDGAWDKLNWKQRSILTDYQYNVSGGLKEFPKLMDATYRGDVDTMLKESTRHTDGKPLTRRNKAIALDIDSLRTAYPVQPIFSVTGE